MDTGPRTWPPALIDLTLSARFNQRLELLKLPETLRSLTLGRNFNQMPGAVGDGGVFYQEQGEIHS